MVDCKICEEKFETDKAFHSHLKKIHGEFQQDYYVKHYPRKSLLYKRQIPFLSKKEYFNTEFLDYNEFYQWCLVEKADTVKEKIKQMVGNRIQCKNYQFAPFYLELHTLNLPSIHIIKKFFGSYNNLCREMGKEPLFNKKFPTEVNDPYNEEDFEILIDTREQQPLNFKRSRSEKLFVGDYLLSSGDSCRTFVDRKSTADFIGTLSFHNLERFKKEIEKAQFLDSYLFVVVEDTLLNVINHAKKFRKNSSCSFVFHNMRELCHQYPRRIQFLFSGSRKNSEKLIPKLLLHGTKLWQTDVQYFIDKGGI